MYLSFYNLKEEPFRLTPDPRFLHMAEPHRAALATLVTGVLRHKGFVLATGPVGTGKTTLLHAALHILSQKEVAKGPIATAFLINPTLTREEFLEALLEEFEVPSASPSKPKRLIALHEMLLKMQRGGGTAAVFIDEAHLLSLGVLEEIRLLSNADTYSGKLLQIVLTGQPELLDVLAKPEMRALQQRIASICHLRALAAGETRAYIAERLQAAGLAGPSPFTGAALEAIHKYTQGVPRLINMICDNCLTIGFLTQRPGIQPDMVEEAAAELELIPRCYAPSVHLPGPQPMKSVEDMLIEAMKPGRASAQE